MNKAFVSFVVKKTSTINHSPRFELILILKKNGFISQRNFLIKR